MQTSRNPKTSLIYFLYRNVYDCKCFFENLIDIGSEKHISDTSSQRKIEGFTLCIQKNIDCPMKAFDIASFSEIPL